MGKYYCDYCDIYLTHDSMNARKAHNTGRNHVANVRDYFAGLNHDKAQNIIDQIIHSHEHGGRQQMMMAPSMRLGAGFMNPMTTQQGGFPGSYPNQAPPFPPQGSAPPFRPPFPPPGMGAPPFPPPGGMNGFPPAPGGLGGNGTPPFPPPNMPNGAFPPPGFPGAPPPTLGGAGIPFRPPPAGASPNGAPPPGGLASQPPPSFTPATQVPAGAAPGIHPDRLRMMGTR
ncbi:hypothetical protein IAU60_003774 [Kwoniella sp. DSM 27419]